MTQATKTATARARRYSLNLSQYYRKPSTQVSLSVVLSIFIITFFILVALRPTFTTIATLNTEIEQSTKTLQQLSTKSKSLEQATRLWEEIQADLPFVEVSIPQNSPSYESLSKSIELVASEAGVEITSVSVGSALLYSGVVNVYEGRDQSVVEMDLSIRVTGGYANTMDFLQKILSVDRLIGVSSVTINRESATASDSQVGMAITGTVQYLGDSAKIESVTNAGGKK